jgi:hypothetical protein
MQEPIHVRRRHGRCDLATFLARVSEQPCPVVRGGTWLCIYSYGGTWEARLSWNSGEV